MEIKTAPPMTVLCHRQKVKINDLMTLLVRTKVRELYAASQKAGLEVCGPLYWNYYGIDGNPETEFMLEIAIPITPANAEVAPFEIRSLPAFRYVSEKLHGSWDGIGPGYGKLIPEAWKAGLQPNDNDRDVYLHIDFEHPENNITEIQVGVN